jgi:hypothetical protein
VLEEQFIFMCKQINNYSARIVDLLIKFNRLKKLTAVQSSINNFGIRVYV